MEDSSEQQPSTDTPDAPAPAAASLTPVPRKPAQRQIAKTKKQGKKRAKKRRKTGDPRVFSDPYVEQCFFTFYAITQSIAQACQWTGCNRQRVYDERDRNPDFAEKLESARMGIALGHVIQVDRMSKAAGDWRGQAWIAERIAPEHFGQKPVQVGGKHNHLHVHPGGVDGTAGLKGGSGGEGNGNDSTNPRNTDVEDAEYIQFVADRLAADSQQSGGAGLLRLAGGVEVLPALGAPQPTRNGSGGGPTHNGHANGRNGHH
jgi:hypothetical protein